MSSPLLFLHSDHDDEVASLASTSGGFGAKASAQRLPVKDWKVKASPRASPKLKRKAKKDDGYAGLARAPRLRDQLARARPLAATGL